MRHRDRLVQHFGDRVRQLHRLVDLGFPEFTRYIRSLGSELASAVLHDFPTAQAFQGVTVRRLARLCYDGRHRVGEELACSLIEAAKVSVGHHHGFAYRLQVRHACEDLATSRCETASRRRDSPVAAARWTGLGGRFSSLAAFSRPTPEPSRSPRGRSR